MIKYFRVSSALLFSILLFLSSYARTDDALSSVHIELSGLAEAEGTVHISVYDSEDNWLGEGTVHRAKVVIAEALDGDIVRTSIELKPGNYALSMYFDEDGDGDLDTNFIGIPKEPVAMSNNARPKFGPPKYEDAVFVLGAEPVVQKITIKAI